MVAVYGSSVEQNHSRCFEKQVIEKPKKFIFRGQGAVHRQVYGHIQNHCI